jgi:prevent-host-death family protein
VHQVTIEEAKIQLPELIEAAVQGEDVFITKQDQQVVKLVAVVQSGQRPQFGSARGLIEMSDDFDEPLPDFDEFMQ